MKNTFFKDIFFKVNINSIYARKCKDKKRITSDKENKTYRVDY